MNVENMLKVARSLTPTNYRQNNWCGTHSCIAGHAALLAFKGQPAMLYQMMMKQCPSNIIIQVACQYLGITHVEGVKLFNGAGNQWCYEARDMLMRSMSISGPTENEIIDPERHVKAGVRQIEYTVAEYMSEGLPPQEYDWEKMSYPTMDAKADDEIEEEDDPPPDEDEEADEEADEEEEVSELVCV